MKFTLISALAVLVLSCSFTQPEEDQLTVEEKALISLMVRDYSLQEQLADTGSLEGDDLNDETDAIAADSSSARSLSVISEDTYLLDDGTELVIMKDVDDGDTVDITSDDELTISRFYYFDSRLWKTEEIIRPLKPEANWELWDGGQLIQNGSIAIRIGSTEIATGTLQVLWALESDEITLKEMHRSTFNISTNIKRVNDTFFSEDGISQTITKFFWNGTELIEISSFSAEVIEIEGETYTRLNAPDGSYILIRQKHSPQTRQYYDSQDQLLMVETIGKNGGVRTEVTRDFYEDGVPVSSMTFDISYKIEEDSVTVTRRTDSGLGRYSISITESAEGYMIERKGIIYQIRFTDSGTVQIYSETGVFLAEISTDPHDSAIVTEPDGTTAFISF